MHRAISIWHEGSGARPSHTPGSVVHQTWEYLPTAGNHSLGDAGLHGRADLWEHLISLEVPLHASGVESSLTHPRSAKTKWPGLAGRLGSGVQGRAVLKQGVSLALALRSYWVRPSSEGKALRSREEPLCRTGRDYTWVRDPLQ